MPGCSEISLMLGAAGDGELAPGQAREVAGHISQCAACAVELSDYGRIGTELRAIATMPSLEKFTKSVLDLIGKLVIVAIFAAAVHAYLVPAHVKVAQTAAPATVASKTESAPLPRQVDVRVESSFAADKAFGSFSTAYRRTESGKMLVFTLPGGRTVHVEPRTIAGGRIALKVVVFEGTEPAMSVELSLDNGETLALTGNEEGTLLLKISTTAAAESRLPKLL